MRTLAVMSGKGGTGKTTLVACFAALAGRAVAVDCDVDAANLALLLPGEDSPGEPFYGGQKAAILAPACSGCGACAQMCRFNALDVLPSGAFEVDPLACEGCGACRLVCPVPGVISFHPNLAGHWYVRRTAQGWLVHAALGVAQDNSGKLVARVREEAAAIATREALSLVLVDGPPGIGCPVHAALGRVDRLLAVTEPTPSGLHDLDRLLDLAAHFDLSVCVAVNKWDLSPTGTETIEARCAARGVEVLGRLPFDPAVPRLLAAGRLPLEAPANPETVRAIRALWDRFAAPA
ncbi:MAG: 4Fe-4S dicluster domain-containing protein [Pseudomonadota bacterium]